MKNKIQKPKYYLSNKPVNAHETKCPNCGTLHIGNYCYRCGQSADVLNKPFKDFLSDILGSIYAFDYRFWHSVKVMFTHPEKLSEEYLAGKRTHYTPPFRLYFFVSFIFFFTMNWMTDADLEADSDKFNQSDSAIVLKNVKSDSPTIELLRDTIHAYGVSDSLTDLSESQGNATDIDSIEGNPEKKIFDFSENKLNNILKHVESRKLFMNRAYSFLSWMLFLLMPIFALLLQLLYRRSKHYYIRHLVFAVNTHTQSFIIFIVFIVLNYYMDDNITEIHNYILLLFPIYLLWGMKNYYKQSWIKTFAKFFILTTLYNFVLLAAFVIVFVIAFGTY